MFASPVSVPFGFTLWIDFGNVAAVTRHLMNGCGKGTDISPAWKQTAETLSEGEVAWVQATKEGDWKKTVAAAARVAPSFAEAMRLLQGKIAVAGKGDDWEPVLWEAVWERTVQVFFQKGESYVSVADALRSVGLDPFPENRRDLQLHVQQWHPGALRHVTIRPILHFFDDENRSRFKEILLAMLKEAVEEEQKWTKPELMREALKRMGFANPPSSIIVDQAIDWVLDNNMELWKQVRRHGSQQVGSVNKLPSLSEGDRKRLRKAIVFILERYLQEKGKLPPITLLKLSQLLAAEETTAPIMRRYHVAEWEKLPSYMERHPLQEMLVAVWKWLNAPAPILPDPSRRKVLHFNAWRSLEKSQGNVP